MTLTDIISKIILYAKQAIVNDNSSNNAVSISQSGSGTALSVNQSGSGDAARFQGGSSLKGTLKIFSGTGSDFDYDGGSDGVFIFSNTSSAPTKATAFSGANVGIGTTSPAKTLHVNGTVRLQGLPTYANNAAAIAGGLVVDDVYKTATGELRIVV